MQAAEAVLEGGLALPPDSRTEASALAREVAEVISRLAELWVEIEASHG